DELWPDSAEARVATAFNRHYPDESNARNLMQRRQEILDDITDVVGSTFLGLTMGCARCHNHKFDPILQSDYYRLQALFAATEFKDVDISTSGQKSAHQWAMKAWEARLDPVKKEIAELEKPYREKLKEQRKARLEPKYRAVLEIPADKRTPEQ